MSSQVFKAAVQVQKEFNSSLSNAHPKTTIQFFDVLRDQIFADYVDEDKPLTYGGMTVSAADKYGTAGTYIISKALEDISSIISIITNIESFKTKMYEQIRK